MQSNHFPLFAWYVVCGRLRRGRRRQLLDTPHHYLSQRLVQPHQHLCRADDPDQSVLCHSFGNWELQLRCDLVGELRDHQHHWCLYSARHRSNVGHGDDHRDLYGRCNQIRSGEHHGDTGGFRERFVLADIRCGG